MSSEEQSNTSRLPHPRLRPFVSSYAGYRLSGLVPGVHAGLPSCSLTMIIAFDEQLDVINGHHDQRRQFWAMLGGLHSAPAIVHHQGSQHGIQLDVTPRGAAALFGVPASTIARQLVPLGQLSPFGTELVDRVSTATTWRARWAILDEIFLRSLNLDRELPPELEHAWSLLCDSHGLVQMNDLAAQIGWSRRHLTKKFNEHYGLAPKTMGRVLRFERAQRMVRLPTRPSLGSVAALCGYADQAHMTRDWVEFAGSAPARWLASELVPAVSEPHPDMTTQEST